MALHLRPVGPLPPSVYWRRRAVVLGVGLVLLALLATCGGAPDEPRTPVVATAPAPPAGTSPGPSAPGQASAGAPGVVSVCTDAVLRVEATPARARYALPASPVLRLAVRNGGQVPCSRPLGQGAVELLVLSGSDRIWSSDDCAPGGPEGPVVLQPQELRVVTLTWNGRRSRPGCPPRAEQIAAGTYRVLGRVGTLRTPDTSFLVG